MSFVSKFKFLWIALVALLIGGLVALQVFQTKKTQKSSNNASRAQKEQTITFEQLALDTFSINPKDYSVLNQNQNKESGQDRENRKSGWKIESLSVFPTEQFFKGLDRNQAILDQLKEVKLKDVPVKANLTISF